MNTEQKVRLAFKKFKGQPDILRGYLKYIFGFERNIDVFSKFFFPHFIKGEVPLFHKELYKILFREGNDAFAAPRNHAKAQSLNSKILTPDGWVLLKNIKEGDIIIGGDGLPTKVLVTHPISKMDLYRVKTRDGRSTLCNLDHLWDVEIPSNTGNRIRTMPLRDILKNYKFERYSKKRDEDFIEDRYFIHSIGPVNFKKKELLIDPYLLGLWLGDGHSAGARITSAAPEIFSYINNPYKKTKGKYLYQIYGLQHKLRILNLVNNKHIPNVYLFSSISQREALLQGLVDTDGHIQPDGLRFDYTTILPKLKDDFVALVRSLGGTARVGDNFTKCNGKMFHSFRITCRVPKNIIPARLSRKRNVWKGSVKTKSAIVDISFEKNDFGRCITVDNVSGTYVTDDYLLTHNSTICLIFILWNVIYKRKKYIVYVSQNHTKTVQFIEPMRFEFKNNELLRSVYGNMILRKGLDNDGKDKEGCFDVNGVRLEAVSFEKSIRGFKYMGERPGLIVGDDIEEDQRVLNPDLRVKDAAKLNKVIIPSLSTVGYFKFIGTILHLDSLLYKKIKQYNGVVYKAIENDDTILWEAQFNKTKLDEIKKDIGSIAFQQEYLNNPIDNETSIIKREWVQACYREDLSSEDVSKMEFGFKVLGVDFAFSDRVTADQSAFVSFGVKDDFYYLIGCETKKGWSALEQFNYIKDVLHKKWYYEQIGVEENSIRSISKNLQNYDLPLTLFWTGTKDASKKKNFHKDYEWMEKKHTIGKNAMIMRLGVAFENKKFIIPYKTEEDKKIADQLLAECTSYSLNDGKLVEAGVHPDIPIGMCLCLELINGIGGVYFDFGNSNSTV